MTVFILAAALLIVAALLFIVPPLLRHRREEVVADRRSLNISIYQDQFDELERDLANDVITRDQYEQSKQELEMRLLEDVPDLDEKSGATGGKSIGRSAIISAVIVAAVVPVLGVSIYMYTGMPGAITMDDTGRQQQVATLGAGSGAGNQDLEHQIGEMVARLESRLDENPNDVEGWTMLGRSYLALERYDLALPALERAVEIGGNDPQLLVDFADVLAMTTNNMSLEGRPMELIEQALEIDPRNQKGLWLAGTAKYERQEFREALEYWRRLHALVQPGSDADQAMRNNIAEVESLIAQSGGEVSSPPSATETAPAGSGKLEGTVTLDESLREQVNPSDTVFIFARATEGPRMPLAVLRARVDELPMDFMLDDSMAMDPSLSLSQFSEVVVVARISRSGSAMAGSGDLQGTSAVVGTDGNEPARVMINEVLP